MILSWVICVSFLPKFSYFGYFFITFSKLQFFRIDIVWKNCCVWIYHFFLLSSVKILFWSSQYLVVCSIIYAIIFYSFILAFRNCADIFKSGQKRDGVYIIKPDNQSAFNVFCDQTTAGGGWTVFQKRIDGSVDFNLNWSDYKHGFGNLSGEFWLGLDRIHRLTLDNNSMLRVDMEDFEGESAYAEYSLFGVRSEHDKYRLILGSYNTTGD